VIRDRNGIQEASQAMSDIVLELALRRSSGVLAGVVASLAQAGLALKSQKLDRSGTGWLTVHLSGDIPDPGMLSERMSTTRGVDRLVQLDVDGETLIADGQLVVHELDDQIEAEDLAALAGSAEPSLEQVEDHEFRLFEAEQEAVVSSKSEPEPEPHAEDSAAQEDELLFAAALDASDTELEASNDADSSDDRPLDPAERMQTALRRRRRRRR